MQTTLSQMEDLKLAAQRLVETAELAITSAENCGQVSALEIDQVELNSAGLVMLLALENAGLVSTQDYADRIQVRSWDEEE